MDCPRLEQVVVQTALEVLGLNRNPLKHILELPTLKEKALLCFVESIQSGEASGEFAISRFFLIENA